MESCRAWMVGTVPLWVPPVRRCSQSIVARTRGVTSSPRMEVTFTRSPLAISVARFSMLV